MSQTFTNMASLSPTMAKSENLTLELEAPNVEWNSRLGVSDFFMVGPLANSR